MEKYYLTLDIGGTKTSAALFSQNGEILRDYILTKKSETFKGEEAVYQNTRNILEELLERLDISRDYLVGIGVGSPGPLDTKRGLIVHAPLMGWKNFPIVQRLEEDFNLPVILDNDGNLGALAELRAGVGRDCENLIYVTVSTGCGGGIIINKKIYRGYRDGAGEVGHMSIMPEGLLCPCGSRGCLEMYASGTALNARMKKDMEEGKQSIAFELAGYDSREINGKHLCEAAKRGDKYALDMYREEGRYLGIGVANLFNLFDPRAVILGGGVTKAKDFFHASLLHTLKERCIQQIEDEALRYSDFNDKVVLYGAYYLIKDYMEKSS